MCYSPRGPAISVEGDTPAFVSEYVPPGVNIYPLQLLYTPYSQYILPAVNIHSL